MSLWRLAALAALAIFLAIVPAARAQQTGPRVGYVYPAGGRQGSALVVVVGGRFLDGATGAFISGDGVQAKVVDFMRSIRQGGPTELIGKLKKLEQKKSTAAKETPKPGEGDLLKKPSRTAWTADDEMLLLAYQRKLAAFVGGPPVPAIADSVLVQVTIAPNAEPGQREIRLETPKGLTNPLAFCVGQLKEFSKEPVISEEVLTGKNQNKYRDEPRIKPPEPPTKIMLPAVANGQMMPGTSDRYEFQARKGQHLVVAAAAQELIPYISDAVPGWFQAALALYDAKGRELAYADHYLFHPDPVLHYEVPEDGQYVVEIRDSIYRGREDFVYRITIGEVPYLAGVFPLGGQAGTQTRLELVGWNLPTGLLVEDTKDKEPGIYPFRVHKEELFSNVLHFAVDTLPEVFEKEPNNQPASAQQVTLPVVVNGRIEPADEWDVFRLEGTAGSEIVAEVYARRLNSPLDSVLKLTDAAGKRLAINDDHEDKGAGLTTHHADSYLRATLPANGTYYLHLGDAQHKGGPEYAYRLRISPSRPDFDLRVVPSSFTIRGGASIPVTVYALRRDGFNDEIKVALKDAADGATLSEGTVPAGQDQVKMTLKIPPMAPDERISLIMEGRATIQGHEVSRAAVPADDMTQAFEYRHLVPAQELKVVATLGRFVKPSAKVLGRTPVRIPAGGTAQVQISVVPRSALARVHIELRKPPEGISIEKVSPSRDGVEIVLATDAEKVKPGQRGSLTLAASAQKRNEADKAKPQAGSQRMPLPTLPNIPFEIVKPPANSGSRPPSR